MNDCCHHKRGNGCDVWVMTPLGDSHVSVAMTKTQNKIASVLQQQGKFDEALKMYEASLKTKREALGEGHASVADTKTNIGIVYQQKGDQTAAKAYYKEAYDIHLKTLGPSHPTTADLAPFI